MLLEGKLRFLKSLKFYQASNLDIFFAENKGKGSDGGELPRDHSRGWSVGTVIRMVLGDHEEDPSRSSQQSCLLMSSDTNHNNNNIIGLDKPIPLSQEEMAMLAKIEEANR